MLQTHPIILTVIWNVHYVMVYLGQWKGHISLLDLSNLKILLLFTCNFVTILKYLGSEWTSHIIPPLLYIFFKVIFWNLKIKTLIQFSPRKNLIKCFCPIRNSNPLEFAIGDSDVIMTTPNHYTLMERFNLDFDFRSCYRHCPS